MSIAPLVFQGVSSYSTDFQSIVDRAVSIARGSLPADGKAQGAWKPARPRGGCWC